jgi:hypothetical protein
MEKNLSKALLKAQAEVAGVVKNARNEFAKYDYVSADGMVSQLRNALISNGLLFNRSSWFVEGTALPLVRSNFSLIHVESGEERHFVADVPIVETKGRPADKAVLGAVTTALSYTLRDLLLVPRVDDLEVDNRSDDEVVRRPAAPANASQLSPLAKEVEKESQRRDDGGSWLSSCMERASAVEGRPIKMLSQMPDELLQKMLESSKENNR